MPGQRGTLSRCGIVREKGPYHRRQFRHGSRKDPEQCLEIQYVPQMRRIPLVKYTENHDGQQGEIFDKINHDAPLELRRAGDATGTQCWDPLRVTLSHTWYQQRQRGYIEGKRNSTFVRAYQMSESETLL